MAPGWPPRGARDSLCAFDGERAHEVAVSQRETFAGLHTVYDLSVESELHNFVAEGFLVHNKQPPPCTVPGSTVTVPVSQPGPACTCGDGGTGRWTCRAGGGSTVCELCGADGGI